MENRRVKVLVADDEAHIRTLVSLIVGSLGAEVIAEASDGEQALELFVQHQPDMVILDINMPRLDGVAVLKRIMELNPRTLVVVLSSLNALEVVKECIDLGAWNYILKNVTADELRIALSDTWQDYLNEISSRRQS
ncbi:MAG: response regulator [Gallionella sp.]|nr:response regulator [Gallionella sp.]